MSPALFVIGLIIFIVGLPWLAAAVGVLVWALRSLAKALYIVLCPARSTPHSIGH